MNADLGEKIFFWGIGLFVAGMILFVVTIFVGAAVSHVKITNLYGNCIASSGTGYSHICNVDGVTKGCGWDPYNGIQCIPVSDLPILTGTYRR